MKRRSITIGKLVDDGLADIQTGPFGTQLKASAYVDDGIPVINVRNIGHGSLKPEKLEYVNDETAHRLSMHLLKANDIVFGRKGAVDRHLFVRKEQENWLQGSDCMMLRIWTSDVNPQFLSYCFLAPSHQTWMIAQSGNKATMASLNQDTIKRITVPLPDRAKQDRVVEVLSRYDDLMQNNLRRIKLLEESARLLYEEWFVRHRFPGHEHARIVKGVPEGWEKKHLGELCEEIKETVLPERVDPETPYIGLEHMPRKSITLSTWAKAEDVTSTKHAYKAGDVLFGKIRLYFHKVGFALTDGVASSDAIVIRALDRDVQNLVLLTVSSDGFVADTSQRMKEGSKMPRADWGQMQQWPVRKPKSGILNDFNGSIDPILAQLRTLSFANIKLRQARDILLPKLMSGEIEA
jgi:type I restriction enzyme S subunit